MKKLAKTSKVVSKVIRSISHETRKKVLLTLSKKLLENTELIIKENNKDLAYAEKVNLSQALKDRLLLNEDRIKDMANGVKSIANQDEDVGEFFQEFTNEEGLKIKRHRIPLGVILMIFESRPNVVIDCAAFALKSSNAIILKGGKEAKYSNEILGKLVQEVLESENLPKETVQVLASDSREEVNSLLSMDEYIDVVIPRGGERLIEHVYANAKMPVIAHFKGLCHMYIDDKADLNMAMDLVINAKTQRTGVCNDYSKEEKIIKRSDIEELTEISFDDIPKSALITMSEVDLGFEMGDGYYDVIAEKVFEVKSEDKIIGYVIESEMSYTEDDDEEIFVNNYYLANGIRIASDIWDY